MEVRGLLQTRLRASTRKREEQQEKAFEPAKEQQESAEKYEQAE